MSKKTKIILRYPKYQNIIDQYLSLDEFEEKTAETMRSKRVTVTAFCNYLGDQGIESINLCLQKHVVGFMENISSLSTSTKSGKTFILRHFFNFLYAQGLIIYSGRELFPVIVTNKRDRISCNCYRDWKRQQSSYYSTQFECCFYYRQIC